MCYLVTGINNREGVVSLTRAHAIYDREEEAREEAEKLVNLNYSEVVVWKQIATPKIVKTISWEEPNAE